MRARTALMLLGPLLSGVGLSACTTMQPKAAIAPGYIVFFAERSAVLEPTAADVITRAAAAASTTPNAPVAVLGWTDSGGSARADVTLSQQRAQTVADALVADGVAASRITRQGRGQTHDDPGVESRRVEIRVGG